MRTRALLVALVAAVALPASAAAAALPKITTVAPLAAASPGTQVRVLTVFAGAGGRSRRTSLAFLLSHDRKPDARDQALSKPQPLPALARRSTRRLTKTIAIPRRAKLGRWYLLACVGSASGRRCTAVPLPILAPSSARSVTVITDPAHATTQRITAATGGTVTATGADGSRYMLVLPANALITDETISLTPVTGLRGLRGHGRPAAGVQLGPDGLVLLKPATLTITPASGVPVARQIGFSWHGSGQQSGLYPPTTDRKSFTLRLAHFSGYELIDGSAKDRASLTNQPTNVQDRWAEVEAAVAAARTEDSPAANARFERALHNYLQTQYDAVVKPQLDAAIGDDTLAYSALQAGLSWAHNVAVLGTGFDVEQRYVLDAMAKILDTAIEASAKRCDAGQIAFVQRILSLARIRAVLGSGESNADLDAIRKCLSFKLDFTASSTQVAGWTIKSTVEVKDLGLTAFGATSSNSGNPPTPVSTSVTYASLAEVSGGHGCSWSFSQPTEQAPFTVYSLSIDASLREVIDSHGRATFQTPPPNIMLTMSPGQYLEPATVQCPREPPAPTQVGTYQAGWVLTHQAELTGQGQYVLTGWSSGAQGQLAQLRFDRTVPVPDCPCSASQQSTFVLRHAAGG